MAVVLPEVFASALIPVLLFILLKAFVHGTKKSKIYVFLSGFTLGYLALIKPIFGYVLLFMIVGMGLILITNRKSINYKKSIIILLIAFATTIPYLTYTYHLTGKILYWSSFGGNNLYWMSSPYKEELGSWSPYPINPGRNNFVPGGGELIMQRHKKDFVEIFKYKGDEQDDVYKKFAIRNIKAYPLKFIKNMISNAGRMFFNFPYSYSAQKTGKLIRLPVNGIILIFLAFYVIPTVLNWRIILFPIRFTLAIAFLYFGGSLLGSAEPRMFTMIVPILLFWIADILQRTIKLKLKFEGNEKGLEPVNL